MYVYIKERVIKTLLCGAAGIVGNITGDDTLILDTSDCVVEKYSKDEFDRLSKMFYMQRQSASTADTSVMYEVLNMKVHVDVDFENKVYFDARPVLYFERSERDSNKYNLYDKQGIVVRDILSNKGLPTFEIIWAQRLGNIIRVFVRIFSMDSIPTVLWLVVTETEYLGIERIFIGDWVDVEFDAVHKPPKHILGKLILTDVC